MPITSLEQLASTVREFGRERDWQLYHTPKNLTAALIVEAAELLEPFQWLTPEQSLNLPLAAATKKQYDRMIAEGLGELDKSGIAELTFKGRHSQTKV